MNFKNFRAARANLLKNCKKDHVIYEAAENSSVLLSAPHGVYQTRLGMKKLYESGSLCVALELQKRTNSWLIAKTQNNFDDANFDQKSAYKTDLEYLIEKNSITHVIDLHGMDSRRPYDVNLGINFGQNINTDVKLFEKLCKMLTNASFIVSVDQPFCGGPATIAGSSKLKFPKIWSIQIEINFAITNQSQNFERCKNLLNILEEWINQINDNQKNIAKK